MNEEFNNEENISEQELTRVANALDALSKHTNQATTQEWKTIMDKSNKEVKKQASRTRMFAVAASILLVVAIGGTVLAVANNSDSKAIKTVDDKDKTPVTKPSQETSSTTTEPLTPEDELLANAYLLKGANEGNLGGRQIFSSILYNAQTIEKLSDPGVESFDIPYGESFITGSHAMFTPVSECEGEAGGITYYDYDFKKKTIAKLDSSVRSWSPSGKKYSEVETNCEGSFPLNIFDASGKKLMSFTPVSSDSRTTTIFGQNFKVRDDISMGNIIWIDDNRFLFKRTTNEVYAETKSYTDEYGEHFVNVGQIANQGESKIFLGDLTKNFSLENAPEKLQSCCDNPDQLLIDAKVESNKIYALIQDSPYVGNIRVIDLITGETIWSKKLDFGESFEGLSFGKTINDIYGSYSSYEFVDGFSRSHAFGYSHNNDTLVKPDGALMIPIR